jgi:hypothetical protein
MLLRRGAGARRVDAYFDSTGVPGSECALSYVLEAVVPKRVRRTSREESGAQTTVS